MDEKHGGEIAYFCQICGKQLARRDDGKARKHRPKPQHKPAQYLGKTEFCRGSGLELTTNYPPREVEDHVPKHNDVQDHSQSNPKLHRLYVKWAKQHLTVMHDFCAKMESFSNLNCFDAIQAVRKEMQKLIRENRAYEQAAAQLFAGMSVLDAADKASTYDDEVEGCED